MKAIIKKSGLEVFLREDITPKHTWNNGKVAVSKQEEGIAYFCVNQEDLELK
jgi:hypothetical protein